MGASSVAARGPLVCFVCVLLQLAACSDDAVEEAASGVGSLRGAAASHSSSSSAAADAVLQANATLLASLADSSMTFVEDGYTARSGHADAAAAAGNSSGSNAGLAAMIAESLNGSLSSSGGGAASAGPAGVEALARSALAARLYEHPAYEGAQLDVSENIPDLGAAWTPGHGRSADNRLSSIVVYPYWCVTLYDDAGFAGSWRSLCAGSSVLGVSYLGNDWGDRASSIRVARRY